MNPLLAAPETTIAPAQETADLLCKMPTNIFAIWENGMQTLWQNHRGLAPQDIFTALGTRGGPLLAASSALVAALEDQAPGCTDAAMALLLPLTVDENGNVTVTTPNAPAPETPGVPV